jgi:GGDEF domain-containing protein
MANIFDQFDAVEASGNIFDQFDVRVKPKEERSDFVRGAKEAFQQLPQLGYGVVAGAGAAIESAVGEGGIATGIKNAGVKGYQEWGDKIARDAKESDSFSYSYDKAKEGDFGAMVDWLQHGLGYAGGQGIQMLATAGIGSVVGKAGLKVAAEKLASGMVAKESARIAAAEGGAELAADQIAKMAIANVAAKIGQTAAIGATAYGMEGGEIGGDMAAKSVAENRSLTGEELAKAFGATLAAGSLEFIGDKVGLDVMLGKSALTKPASSMAGLGGRAVRGTIAAAGAAPIEGATEYGQTLLEEYGKGNDPFSEESRKQAGDAAALGALGGAAMGGVGGAIQSVARPAEQNKPPADPLLLTNDPDPYISFQDGTVGRRADVENYVNSLPEDQRIDVRARLFGLGAQAVEQPSIDGIIGAQSVDEAIDAAKTVINDSSAIDAQLKNEQIDTAWRAYAANLSKQREQEFASAEQSRREADIQAAQQQIADQRVELANAITQAQGFDTPEPTAMQLAMQKAAERKKLMLTPVSKRAQAVSPQDKASIDSNAKQQIQPVEPSSQTSLATQSVPAQSSETAKSKGSVNQLKSNPASWVIKERATGMAVMETFDRKKVDALNTGKYEAVPIIDYLAELNKAQGQAVASSAELSGIKAEVAKIEARRSARTEKPAAVKRPILADSAPSSTPMVDAIQGGEQPMLKSVTRQSAMADFGLLNERDPGVIASLQKLAEMQSAEIPKFTPVKNGFSAREYATKFGPRQEIKAPNGAIAARGLDTNGKPYFEMSGNGTLGQFMSGAPFHEFNDYFNNKSGSAEDRRTDFSRRKAVSEMSPEEMRKSLLISDLTGLPNKRAFDEHVHDNPSDNVLYGDLDDFKSLNAKYGHDGADQILRGVGAVKAMIANRMGVKPYHRSGDEFLATHANNAKLETYGKELQDELANASFNITMPDGSIVVHKKVGFSYGTGQTQQLAERKSDEQKSKRKQLGLRIGQREAIPVAGEGRQDNQRDAAGRDSAPSQQVTSDQTAAASKILDAAGITGAERIDRLKDIKSGAISLDELRQAYPAKEATIAELVKEKRAKEATPKATQAEEAEDNPALFFKQGDFPQSEPFKTKTDANLFKAKNRLQATAEQVDGGWTLSPVAGPLTESERMDAARDVRELNKALAAAGAPAVEPLKAVPTANHALARRLADVFGVKVQFVSNNGEFDGVAHKGIAYLTENLKRPELAIAGHEVFHALEQTNQALAKKLLTHIRAYLNEDAVADRKVREELVHDDVKRKATPEQLKALEKNPITEKQVLSEVLADINGAMWLDPKFWAEMRARDESLFRQVAYRFMEAMTKAIESLAGTRFDVNALVTDVDAVRKLIAQTWAEHNKGRDNVKNEAKETIHASVQEQEQAKPADAVRDRILTEGWQGSDEDSNGEGPQDNNGLSFSRSKIIGNNERTRTPEQLRAFKNVGRTIEVPTLKERMAVLWQDAGKKLAQGLADQFAPIKELSGEAYALMRLSKGAGGAFETMLRGGQLKLENGVYNFDDTKRGGVIDRLLTPLQGEMDDFLWWVSANRADKLSKEDREHLFSADDITALKSLDNGVTKFGYEIQHGQNAGQTTHDRTLIYRDALQTFNEFHKNALDMAEQSGLIDPDARKLWESEFYVPFYRVDEESGVRGANIKSGVVRQQAFKTLKGGSGKLNSDLLDNTLQNWAHLLDSAAKNRAAKASLNAAVNMGVAVESTEEATRQMAKSIGRRNNVVWYMDSGKQRYFLVEDPYIMTALQGLEYAGMKGPLMDALSTMKHALTVGVTASPFFKVRNLIRDSVQAIGVSPLDYNVGSNLKQGWNLTDPKSDAYFKLLAGGGTIHFGTMLEGSESKRVRSLVESGVDASTILDNESKYKAFYKRVIEPAIDAYQELGNRGEAINRAALYDQLIKQGKSHAEASLMARDLMDFSMGGAWAGIRFLTQVVPFMNARIQGLYKLGKSAKEDPARFAAVLGTVAMSSIALMLAYSDDEDWKKREDWDRDSYWWFKIGGEAFRIPKPFEIGAIGTLAERGIEYFTSDEMTGERLRKRLYALLSDNLAMNPVPQLVKPVLDIYANKDSFSGRPIESMGMDKLQPEYRFTARTSMTARGVSTAGNAVTGAIGVDFASPVQIDHMIKGYFGWLGSFIVGTGDLIARPVTGQPGGATPDYWKTATGGMISDSSSPSSRYVSQMYDQAKVLEEAYGTYRMLIKQGKAEEAREFAVDNADSLRKHKSVESVKRVEARLNERMRAIERSAKSGDEKRELIQQIQTQKDRIARQIS